MKNILLPFVCLLLLANIWLQVTSLYRRHVDQRPTIDIKDKTTLDVRNRPIQGDKDVAKIIVEFGDYECPYCLNHAKTVLPMLREKFIDRGIIRYAYMNNPLPAHRNAMFVATAAICAGEQSRYWAMHDELIETQPSTRYDVIKIAEVLGLNLLAFDACLEKGTAEKQINEDLQQVRKFRLEAIPSFAVGTIEENGQVLVQKIIRGTQPLKVFERAIADISIQ